MRISTPVNLIILNEKNQVLLVKRAEIEDHYKGFWSVPGGRAEDNETLEEALRREISEELDCQIERFQYFRSYNYILDKEIRVRAIYFFGTITGRITLNKENSKHYWFDFVELKKLKLAFNQDQVMKEFLTYYKDEVI